MYACSSVLDAVSTVLCVFFSWFVSFESEEFAKDTLLDLRTKKRTFRGQSVKARLKTETVVKSYFPVQTAPPIAPVFPLMGYPGYYAVNSILCMILFLTIGIVNIEVLFS